MDHSGNASSGRHRPRPSADVQEAAWIEPRLSDRWATVGSTVPTGFAAYARILHSVEDQEHGVRVRWAQVAAETGRVVHPLVQWEALVGRAHHRRPGDAEWDRGAPAIGDLPPPDLAAVLRVLAGHTSTPDDCWFAVWEGWAGIGPAPEGCRVDLPHREYLLLRGPLESALGIGDEPAPDWFVPQSPNLVWPRDRAWCLATEIDYDSTVVGGSAELIDALLAAPDLEVWRIHPDDSLAWDADTVNELPEEDRRATVDPFDLDEVRRRVVLPVVQSLVRPDELEEVVVDIVRETPPPYWVPRISGADAGRPGVFGIFSDVPEPRLPALPSDDEKDAEQEEWLSVRIRARGEWIEVVRWFPGLAESQDPEWLAGDLYSHLQDELAGSRFAWGELREGDYALPGPRANDA